MSSDSETERCVLRVALADDDETVRRAIVTYLQDSGEFEVICATSTGEDLLRGVRGHDLDVVLLDIDMPGVDGIETARRIKKVRPELKLVMYTAFARDDFLRRALQAGAQGFLSKETSLEQVGDALRAAVAGKTVFDSKPLEMLVEFYRAHTLDTHQDPELEAGAEGLSPRHRAVFNLMIRGMSNREIANQLGLSPGSAKTYASEVLGELGVHSRAELVARASLASLGVHRQAE